MSEPWIAYDHLDENDENETEFCRGEDFDNALKPYEIAEKLNQLEAENEALGELLSPLVDVELERDKLKAENEALRNGISFIIADSLGDDTSVDWIRIQLNRLLTGEKPETPISDVPITP